MTIIQELHEIEKTIYFLPYDVLTDYLKGIRDIINLLNGDEANVLLTIQYDMGKNKIYEKANKGV